MWWVGGAGDGWMMDGISPSSLMPVGLSWGGAYGLTLQWVLGCRTLLYAWAPLFTEGRPSVKVHCKLFESATHGA